MNNRLKNNLISVIKEAQLKLGYEQHAFGVNYISRSLCHLLGCSEDELDSAIWQFCSEAVGTFGEISVRKKNGGYRFDIPVKGVAYVHEMLSDDEFLSVFIRTVRQPQCTVEQVLSVFRSFSDKVHFEEVSNGEFDYLIYFEEDGTDDFWYCFHDDGLQLEYHRFIKEDYLDFGF